MNEVKKNLLVLLLIVTLMVTIVGFGGSARTVQAAEEYPSKAITLICPFNPGGGTDVCARVFASTAPQYLGQSIVVVNRGGASGSVAHSAFKRNAKPDGYTLIMTGNSPSTIVPNLTKVDYDPVNDFEFIGRIINAHGLLVVKNDASWKDAKQFFAYAKENPGKLKIATSGANGVDDLTIRLMNLEVGIELVPVAFDSAGEGNAAVLGGHVHGTLSTVISVLPMIQNGSMRALGCTSNTRDPSLPDVPTFIEMGYLNVSMNDSMGIAAPKGTPTEVIAFLEDVMKKTLEDPGFKGLAKKLALTIDYLNAADFKEVTAEVSAKVKKIVSK